MPAAASLPRAPAAARVMSDPPASDDAATAALTARLVRGEEAAWDAFHAAYFGRLLAYLLVVTRGEETAARDALQATFARVVRHMRRFDSEAALWSWLTVVARSCAVDSARSRSRYRALLENYFAFLRPTELAPAPPPADEALAAALARLDPADRELLVAKYVEGVATRDLALAAGCSEKAMESRLARIRATARRYLLPLLES